MITYRLNSIISTHNKTSYCFENNLFTIRQGDKIVFEMTKDEIDTIFEGTLLFTPQDYLLKGQEIFIDACSVVG